MLTLLIVESDYDSLKSTLEPATQVARKRADAVPGIRLAGRNSSWSKTLTDILKPTIRTKDSDWLDITDAWTSESDWLIETDSLTSESDWPAITDVWTKKSDWLADTDSEPANQTDWQKLILPTSDSDWLTLRTDVGNGPD